MKKCLLILLSALLGLACSRENQEEVEPRLVVEGWIESGGAPVVLVTTSVTPSRELQAVSSLTDNVERWARVKISDGENEVFLTGYISGRYFPPYYYTTGRMLGETGKTYKITVDSNGRHAEAYATIPPPQQILRLDPVPYGDEGGLYLLKATVPGGEHYKFFTLIEGTDKSYVPAITSLAEGTGSETEITIRPGNSLNREEKRPAFRSGEKVYVKCCTMEDVIYRMWETLDNLIYLDTTAFFTLDTNLPGNVDGAIGYFAGYGKAEYKITIPGQ